MQNHLLKIVECSLGSTPEDMLSTSLNSCIEIAGADGGSILGEEGPSLKFLFSDVEDLIGVPVPFTSVAGETTINSLVIYTYAPKDKRHYIDVDEKTKHQTKYLLSIPIPSVNSSTSDTKRKNAGALQLLFEDNIFPDLDVEGGPQEFFVDDFKDNAIYSQNIKEIFLILPIIAFGMEIVKLRQTSYQAIHELKNKMISGLSWLNYLKDDIKDLCPAALDDDGVKEDFELAESSIREGSELAKTYLQFTKIFSPKFESSNINDVLKVTAASVKAFAKEMKSDSFRVSTDLCPDIEKRQIDSNQLNMAFFNLCKNSVEALVQSRAKTPNILITSAIDGELIRISIKDNGPGMPKEIADNLFIPFKTKKEGGTGLGLTITKKIIDIHSGTISCNTGTDGTVFKIEL